jgi:hypothetical protein
MKQTFDIYKQYFGVTQADLAAGRVINGVLPEKQAIPTTVKGIELIKYYNGREVFLPIQFYKNKELFLELFICTARITTQKTIIRTLVSEQKGTIKEQFNIGDYIISIKGMLVGENQRFPDEQLLQLRELYETTDPVELYCALTELFMDGSRRVAISSLELPEVEGKGYNMRPFALECETDFVETLILN